MILPVVLALTVVLPIGALLAYDYFDRRDLRRAHLANPHDQRWSCHNPHCTLHLRHRGACNQDGAQ